MKTEGFNTVNAVCKIDGIRFCLVCKILGHEMGDVSAVNALVSIAQIDEGELNQLRELIDGMFTKAKKVLQKALLEGGGQEIKISDGNIDMICIIEGDMEYLVKRMISFIQNGEHGQAMNMLVSICFKAYDKQKREQQLEAVRESINHVFVRARELKQKGFIELEKMIAEAARPVENGKPIAELKEKTTEAIRLVQEWRLGQKELKWYMDLEISKIYLQRAMREYENLWERAKDASADETIGLIRQSIGRLEDKRKADWHKSEQNGATDTVQEVNKIIKDSLSEAGVQDANEWSEIFRALIDVFAKQDILYRGSADYYNRLLEIGKKIKS